ncbi:hypothetical protein JB92DRAFT_2868267 [Gautieria morchelliformis]|nr:hypothetical protein JB92DRAFT_2868267 [Gautieria morchelliformis]
MEHNVIACLDNIPLIQIQWSAYLQCLSGSMAAWENRNQRYHGHQTLSHWMAEKARAAYA